MKPNYLETTHEGTAVFGESVDAKTSAKLVEVPPGTPPVNLTKPARESVSKTMLKKIKALSKNELVDKLVATSNYAEEMKAANMILMYQVKQLNDQLNKNKLSGEAQDASAETSNQSEGKSDEVS